MDKNKRQALANVSYNLFETLKQTREEFLANEQYDNAEKIKVMMGTSLDMYYDYTREEF